MAVFALEGGRLVSAQSFDLHGTQLATESLAAIRERVIDLLDSPLFPVAWQAENTAAGTRESMLALDPTGQVVTVEVLERLDSEELLGALARAGQHGDSGRARLASIYGPGSAAFSADWRTFLDACEPHPAPGPRLFLVVLSIDPAVRSAVDALSGAGLHVRLASMHDAGTHILVSFEEVKPRGAAFHSILARPVRPGIGVSAPSPDDVAVPQGAPSPSTASVGGGGVPVSISPDSAESAYSAEEARASRWYSMPGQTAPAAMPEPSSGDQVFYVHGEAAEHAESVLNRDDREVSGTVSAPPAASDERPTWRLPRGHSHAVSAAPEPSPSLSTPSLPVPAVRESAARQSSAAEPVTARPSSPLSRVSGYVGPTAFAESVQARETERRRTEQLLWENSAPQREGAWTRARFLSEASAADVSSDAVAMAADDDYRSSAGRLLAIARRYDTPFTVVWRQRRRGINVQAEVTAWGTIVLANGAIFTDPTLAAQAASGVEKVDGWRVWKRADGRSLGEL